MNSYVWIEGEKINIKDMETSQIKEYLEFIENDRLYNHEKCVDANVYQDLIIELISRGKERIKMTNKFTVGSQWETRGGGRAVVVKVYDDHILVWNEEHDETSCHELDGTYLCSRYFDTSLDLIRPYKYKEPEEGKVYVNIIRYADARIRSFTTDDKNYKSDNQISRIAVTWREGQFDD